jgi:hypothetical protein
MEGVDKDKRAINYLVENITCISGIVDFNRLDWALIVSMSSYLQRIDIVCHIDLINMYYIKKYMCSSKEDYKKFCLIFIF